MQCVDQWSLSLHRLHCVVEVNRTGVCGGLCFFLKLRNYEEMVFKLSISAGDGWWQNNLVEDEDNPKEPAQALALFPAEKGNGLHFLEEGTHKFTLRDGRTFTIYASPYTPEFNGYAFAYDPEEDRFGPGAKHPIPEGGVDIVMTHGPPLLPSRDYVLDINLEGNHCGCPMLGDAIRRARPKLHCFGHLHEGYGFQEIRWKPQGLEFGPVLRDSAEQSAWEDGPRTMLVNAAVMNHRQENNKPWVVRLELDYQALKYGVWWTFGQYI
ncbi:Ser/Thr protein phosphatase family protein [Apodospora peruviana]|uniref:Ser/Thr protein phosphatase family protein n=1 Tax=Apodospora peruviana TaxID=516989 RepID=A0AAE0MBD8_9PEZI|nr:Ser/Thr protein phosphatase family protein [Apodospora peruviana]